jgi:hypothetical protein
MTTNILLRGINKIMMQKIKHEAAINNMSINQYILVILNNCLGFGNKPQKILHHDLDKLSGTWTKQEAKQFMKSIEDFEKIDEELWS